MDRAAEREVARIVTITEVNLQAGIINATDRHGTSLRISTHLQDPMVAVPATGEVWIVDRLGVDWFLDRRFETGTESSSLGTLQPGDRRIDTQGTLYLNAGNVVVNGDAVDFQPSTSTTVVAPTSVVAKTAAYTLSVTDAVVTGNATVAAFRLTLPTAITATGRAYVLKRLNSGGNAVTVGTSLGQTIDGAATKVLGSQYAFIKVISNGANWLIISTGGTVT